MFSENNVSFVLRTLLRLGVPQPDAEDVAQEVFIIAYRRAKEFDTSRDSRPWLYGIARNLVKAYWRKRVGQDSLGEIEDVAVRERSSNAPVSRDQADMLRQAVSLLPDPLSEIMMLRDFIGMTLVEAAQELEIPVDTAKDRLRRARDTVRTQLQRWQKEVDCG